MSSFFIIILYTFYIIIPYTIIHHSLYDYYSFFMLRDIPYTFDYYLNNLNPYTLLLSFL